MFGGAGLAAVAVFEAPTSPPAAMTNTRPTNAKPRGSGPRLGFPFIAPLLSPDPRDSLLFNQGRTLAPRGHRELRRVTRVNELHHGQCGSCGCEGVCSAALAMERSNSRACANLAATSFQFHTSQSAWKNFALSVWYWR